MKNFEHLKDMKNRIETAFTILKEQGYECHQNFWCCQTCGLAGLEQEVDYVFYHEQDYWDLKKNGKCYLVWSGCAEVILDAFRTAGILTDWNGDENTRILIAHPSLDKKIKV